jgi:TetR/AcrR family transcriptional regulator, transcriptional repressor for nem operon
MSYPAERRRLNRQKIVRSARRLFNRRGFDTVSIDDVMADVGLTRGRFYSYFESKGDLYAEAVAQILTEKQLLGSDGVSIDPHAVDGAAQFVRPRLSFARAFRGYRRNLPPDRLSDRLFARGALRSASI